MKKRILAIIMAMMLIFGTMPAVFAEAPAETKEKKSIGGLFSSLFGEDGKISNLLEEGGNLLKDLGTKLADKKDQMSRVLNNLKAFVTNEDGSVNWDAVKMLATSLFAGGDEPGEQGEEEIGAQAQEAIRE